MRELKFRAWDNTNQEWTLNIMECVSSSRWDIWLEPALKSHEVIIEQYTGLKDKNGKEIYEGDIVLVANHNRTSFVVVWREEDCSFIASNKFDYVCMFKSLPECYKVIGNIHENPELLESKNAKD